MDLGFNLQLYETATCSAPGRPDLIVELASSHLAAWKVEVREVGGRTIATSYATEAEARRAVETAYRYGRQFGRWHIQRKYGYTPDPAHGSFSPAGWEQVPRRDASA